jgi:hypothetical protein
MALGKHRVLHSPFLVVQLSSVWHGVPSGMDTVCLGTDQAEAQVGLICENFATHSSLCSFKLFIHLLPHFWTSTHARCLGEFIEELPCFIQFSCDDCGFFSEFDSVLGV